MAHEQTNYTYQKKVLLVVASLIFAGILGALLYQNFIYKKSTEIQLPEQAALSVSFGKAGATTKVVIYTDPVCDKCAAYHEETVKRVYQEYAQAGKIELEIRPLSIVTEQSAALTELLMCGNEQGKFWQTSDFVYKTLTRDNNRSIQVNAAAFFTDFPTSRIAVGTEMDEGKLSSCIRDNRYEARIKQADTQAYAANVNSTPMTFIGDTEPVRGYAIYEYIKSLIDLEY